MARSPDWKKLPMAQGDDKPARPRPSVLPTFTSWSFGGGRPFGCVQLTITRERGGQPASFSLHATPKAPLVLVKPGTDCVVAWANTLALRGARRKAAA